MIFNTGKYSVFPGLKYSFCTGLFLFAATLTNGQITTAVKDSSGSLKSSLVFYHSIAPQKVQHPFTHIDYTRPNNQLMSWPNFPLTATEIERRHRQAEQEEKPAAVIARDIITSILKKKPKVAVIPKF